LGVITANKERGGAGAGEIAAKLILTVLLFGTPIPWNTDQKIRVSLVVRPSLQAKAGDDYLVRVTFQRVVRRSDGAISMETLNQPELYTHFFDKLSKAVFIEGKTI
jgi:hypothetical protein